MKKMVALIILLILISGGVFMFIRKSGSMQEPINTQGTSKHILLLGASVGRAWDFPELPKRIQRFDLRFEMIPVYAFDKSEALGEALMRPKKKFRLSKSYLFGLLKPAAKKPNVIIFKECAAYFPGNSKQYTLLVQGWVEITKKNGIKPVLTTVVPVTLDHANKRPGRLEGILEYNDWVKSYCKQNNIDCLDFEAVLRISEANRVLRNDLTSGDGLHLNGKAYLILDNFLLDKL